MSYLSPRRTVSVYFAHDLRALTYTVIFSIQSASEMKRPGGLKCLKLLLIFSAIRTHSLFYSNTVRLSRMFSFLTSSCHCIHFHCTLQSGSVLLKHAVKEKTDIQPSFPVDIINDFGFKGKQKKKKKKCVSDAGGNLSCPTILRKTKRRCN